MIKSKYKSKNKLLKLCVAFLFPFTLFGGIAAVNMNTYAASSPGYVYYYEENISVTNSSFTEGSTPYATGNSLSGWNAIEEASKASGMLIDVGSGTSTDENGANSTFSKNQSVYMLKSNPGVSGKDNRILMINSKQNEDDTNVLAQKGYRSSSITLEANSYYRFTVAVKTMLNGDESTNASVYVSGLKDKDGNTFQIGYENLTNSIWKEYYIFVATGAESQTVTLDLYLGSANGGKSSGAVFFDEVYVNRYSQNAFYELCNEFGYANKDTYESFDSEVCFLVDGLAEDSKKVELDGYNLDFEAPIPPDSNTLGDAWSIVDKSEGHAIISDIRTIQPSYFKDLTGYSYIGDDLSYNNTQAMLLYTDSNGGYVGVESNDIDIKAHGVYKISLQLKVAEISTGSFCIQVQENDTIYNLYPDLVSGDEESDIYHALQNGKSSGITSNVDNNFTNDYQTVEFYVKGHSLYDSSINIQLWLGDSETPANGCVVVDNIEVEYSDYTTFSSASNKLELLSFSSTPDETTAFSNPYFNSTEIDNDEFSYPLPATNWTKTTENERNNESGVIYLYNSDSYKSMYSGKYDWAGYYPGSPNNTTDIDLPNNVYMMYNRHNSYQSITSNSATLSVNSYYKLSFDYFNQNGLGEVNPSQIKVEIIDGNGITLFSQTGISSIDRWNKMEIYLHTAETVSPSVQIKISLGDEDNKVGGIVYLDNFLFENCSSAEGFDEEAFANDVFDKAKYKADLTDYYLNITESGEINSDINKSPAYDLSIDAVYDSNITDEEKDACAIAGIVSGKDNPYGEDFIIEDSNYLALQTMYASSATLKTKYTLTLEADKYYKLNFDLATIFNEGAEDADTDEHDCKYGLKVAIEGYEEVTELVTASQLRSYSIYVHCTEASTPTISFTLVSDCNETTGLALITRLDFTEVQETEYTNAKISDRFGDTVFQADKTAAEDSDGGDGSDTGDTEEPEDNSSAWLLIPSIIMGVAIIVAIVGYFLRKIKIKKIEKIKKESYDRKLSINHDVILMEAQKRRDKEVADLMQAKKLLENDKEKMEQTHKEFVKESRLNSDGKISKELEKELKKYNYDMVRINEKINIIKEKIDTVMSADYLLGIERRIVAEEEDKFREEKKAYKAGLKQQKQETKASKEGKDNKKNKTEVSEDTDKK